MKKLKTREEFFLNESKTIQFQVPDADDPEDEYTIYFNTINISDVLKKVGIDAEVFIDSAKRVGIVLGENNFSELEKKATEALSKAKRIRNEKDGIPAISYIDFYESSPKDKNRIKGK